MDDFKNFQVVHKNFLKSSERLDSKIDMIVNMEKTNQTLME